MARTILGVVVGYLSMVVVVFVSLTASYLAMGVNKVFQPGTYNVTALWLVVMAAFSLVAAIVGGRVCAAIGKRKSAVTGLIFVVIVLGILSALPSIMSTAAATVRDGDVPNLQAMANAREPVLFSLLL